jgi:hypothetical protein
MQSGLSNCVGSDGRLSRNPQSKNMACYVYAGTVQAARQDAASNLTIEGFLSN